MLGTYHYKKNDDDIELDRGTGATRKQPFMMMPGMRKALYLLGFVLAIAFWHWYQRELAWIAPNRPGFETPRQSPLKPNPNKFNIDISHEQMISYHDGINSESRDQKAAAILEAARRLPEMVHIPFEEAVKDYRLQGWEDDWISHGIFTGKSSRSLQEPRVDFVFLWVNGSDPAFQESKQPFEQAAILDAAHSWTHGANRYRDWDELRYAVRSVEKHASSFRNEIQIIVNSITAAPAGKQVPTWLNDEQETQQVVKVISQEHLMTDAQARECLPTFNSLTMENQLFQTPSKTDYMVALSDDMLLGQRHAASDMVSPLFGPVIGFTTDWYNTLEPPVDEDLERFGEKPYLIYSSWLMNRRFGQRKRYAHGHFGHVLSRDVMKEFSASFPAPALTSACSRFRGDSGFQMHPWFIAYHYLIERHREAMLWSLIMLRTDLDGNGHLSWDERRELIDAIKAGMAHEDIATPSPSPSRRQPVFTRVKHLLTAAGLEPPNVNTEFVWTSLDGPTSIVNLDCPDFPIDECLGPSFSAPVNESLGKVPAFSSAVVFERLARQKPDCGDCLLKLVLSQATQGLHPILPDQARKPTEREQAVKALMRYQYSIVDADGDFIMMEDVDQIDEALTEKYLRKREKLPAQLCLNDDIKSEDETELRMIRDILGEFYTAFFPEKSKFEK